MRGLRGGGVAVGEDENGVREVGSSPHRRLDRRHATPIRTRKEPWRLSRPKEKASRLAGMIMRILRQCRWTPPQDNRSWCVRDVMDCVVSSVSVSLEAAHALSIGKSVP